MLKHTMSTQRAIVGLGLVILLLTGCAPAMVVQKSKIIEDIPPKAAYELIQEHQGDKTFVIVDVRTPAELIETGQIEGALNINYSAETFREELSKLDKTNTYLLYCRTGGRSGRTSAMMEELGFQDVYNMTGGITQWIQEDLPVTEVHQE